MIHIISYPRSGNTWMRYAIYLYRDGRDAAMSLYYFCMDFLKPKRVLKKILGELDG